MNMKNILNFGLRKSHTAETVLLSKGGAAYHQYNFYCKFLVVALNFSICFRLFPVRIIWIVLTLNRSSVFSENNAHK